MDFNELPLIRALLDAVAEEGYREPTPIQIEAIPEVLNGRDLLACAQTGTGKTAAFALPILQLLHEKEPEPGKRVIRALVLAPTRELSQQIGASFTAYARHTGLRTTIVTGGVRQKPQTDALRKGVDILVATPGRLLDLIRQGFVHLEDAEVLVLDEADRMLDMGFIDDVRKIIRKLPRERQTMLFSATIPHAIRRLADSILRDPLEIAVTPTGSTVELTDQSLFFVERASKLPLLLYLLKTPHLQKVLVFCRTKYAVDRISRSLSRAGINAQGLHSNKTQKVRERTLEKFRENETRVLVATDIASRGIDVEEITHVVNFDMPNEPDSYVHRIGRTGRAGTPGIAISFCGIEERPVLSAIEKLINKHLQVIDPHPFRSSMSPPSPVELSGDDQSPVVKTGLGHQGRSRGKRRPRRF